MGILVEQGHSSAEGLTALVACVIEFRRGREWVYVQLEEHRRKDKHPEDILDTQQVANYSFVRYVYLYI